MSPLSWRTSILSPTDSWRYSRKKRDLPKPPTRMMNCNRRFKQKSPRSLDRKTHLWNLAVIGFHPSNLAIDESLDSLNHRLINVFTQPIPMLCMCQLMHHDKLTEYSPVNCNQWHIPHADGDGIVELYVPARARSAHGWFDPILPLFHHRSYDSLFSVWLLLTSK